VAQILSPARWVRLAGRERNEQLSHDHELIYPPVQEFWDAAVKGTG
jgi:hypothetical protein